MEKTQRETIAWVDLLRIIACFLVILAHACDPFVGKFDDNPSEFLSGALFGSLVRSCVPLFVMISGVLLLPIKADMGTFYSRRAKRILIPLAFWSILLPVLYYLYLNFGVEATVNPGIVMENYTLEATLTKMYTFLFNFNYDTTPLWYLYMLIGLYLILPIISAWLTQASQRDIKRFLYIWVISTIVPYIQMVAPSLGYTGNYGSMGLFGECYWNGFGIFYYFSGFLGFAVLAYYLKRFPLNWSWKRTLSITIPLFLLGYAITALGFILTQKYFPGSYENLEVVWYFYGINVLMMTVAVFITVQKIKISPSPLLSKIAGLTFGVYLCHFVVVQFAYDLVYPNLHLPPFIQIPLIAIIAFFVSLFIIWLMSLNKLTRKVIQ